MGDHLGDDPSNASAAPTPPTDGPEATASAAAEQAGRARRWWRLPTSTGTSTGTSSRSPRAILGTQAAVAVFAYLWALLCVAALDLFTWQGNWKGFTSVNIVSKGWVFLLNAVVVWLLIMLLAALTNRLWIPLAVITVVTGLAGYANLQKLKVRHEPIYPSDLGFAHQGGFLVEMVGWQQILWFVLVMSGLVLAILWLGRILSKPFARLTRKESPALWRAMLVVRVLVAVSVVVVLNYARHFNGEGNPVRGAYEDIGVHWAWWSQEINYQGNGFVAGYLYNLDVPPMQVPEGYSQETMTRLVDRYRHEADRYNKGRDAALLPRMNIVLVLSEAFSDPYQDLTGVQIPDDPIPYTRKLMSRTASGHMLAQYYGGGTANMEFELLTGLSLAQFPPQLNSPYQQLVPQTKSFPSVVPYLEQKGLDTLAIHPYDPTFYRRSEVYPRLGIDRFISQDDMTHTDLVENNDFISDQAAFDETLDQLKNDQNPLFVNLVTMQNHFPNAGKYTDPMPVKGVSGEDKDQAGGYLRGTRYTDQAVKNFLAGLRKLHEPTAVVFYGDHLPGVWPESITDQNPGLGILRTPFWMWTNFRTIDDKQPPTVSPIYFLPTLFDELDIPLPPYYVLLRKLEQEIPAMEIGTKVGPDGQLLNDDELSPRARRLLHDYALVAYDLAAGKRYSLGGLFYPPQALDQATTPRAQTAPAPRTAP